MKEILMEIGVAMLGLALAVIVFNIAKSGVSDSTNQMFKFVTDAFEAVQSTK